MIRSIIQFVITFSFLLLLIESIEYVDKILELQTVVMWLHFMVIKSNFKVVLDNLILNFR